MYADRSSTRRSRRCQEHGENETWVDRRVRRPTTQRPRTTRLGTAARHQLDGGRRVARRPRACRYPHGSGYLRKDFGPDSLGFRSGSEALSPIKPYSGRPGISPPTLATDVGTVGPSRDRSEPTAATFTRSCAAIVMPPACAAIRIRSRTATGGYAPRGETRRSGALQVRQVRVSVRARRGRRRRVGIQCAGG